MVKASPFIHQPDRVARKASDVSAADWRYQTHVKNTILFHVCRYGFSQGWKSLCNTVVYMIKINITRILTFFCEFVDLFSILVKLTDILLELNYGQFYY